MNTKRFCPQGHDTLFTGRSKNHHCKECRKILKTKWLRNDSFNARAAHKEGNWRKSGILNQDGSNFCLEDFDRAYQIQQGCCANRRCNRHQSEVKGSFCADHDHKTGKFRGLLCRPCNIAIGMAKESKEILEGLTDYLIERGS